MSSTWGDKLKLSIFGESHGEAIGIVLNGIEPGVRLDTEYIAKELLRRAGGHSKLSTPRKEADNFRFVSGVFNGFTTGAPLCVIIPNNDAHSRDYSELKNLMRPSHADYSAFVKYKGFNDYNGGGHFSGRITAALVSAGAIAKQILAEKGIRIAAHIAGIGEISDLPFDAAHLTPEQFEVLAAAPFPVLDAERGAQMQKLIENCLQNQDSIGGKIEFAAIGIPAGVGEPFFDSIESVLAHLLFSIPAVKGVEFGAGFDMAKMYGSVANDAMFFDQNGQVKTSSNNNGGICGGISNGMSLIGRIAIKPTPSIAQEQQTVDLQSRQNSILKIAGRHDPCIVPRAVVVAESAIALGILNLI